MKKWLGLGLTAALAGMAFSGNARADVAWEHIGKVQFGPEGQTMATFRLHNDWSGQKHRAMISYDATPAGAPEEMGKGSVTAIQRFDDDHIIFASSAAKKYVDEPLKTLPGRLRINFWKNLDPELSSDDIPSLTTEQRQRLGQEMRAVVSPFTKKVMRTYFRALPGRRIINSISARGFRVTMLANFATYRGGQEWARLSAEWWLADDDMPDDEEVRAFVQQAMNFKREAGGPTASFWLNEMLPIFWQAQPKAFHQSLESLIGKEGTPTYGFQGTPVMMYLTVAPPPLARMQGGDLRMTLALSRRTLGPLDKTIFDAPTDYERVEIEPLLEKARKMIEQGEHTAADLIP